MVLGAFVESFAEFCLLRTKSVIYAINSCWLSQFFNIYELKQNVLTIHRSVNCHRNFKGLKQKIIKRFWLKMSEIGVCRQPPKPFVLWLHTAQSSSTKIMSFQYFCIGNLWALAVVCSYLKKNVLKSYIAKLHIIEERLAKKMATTMTTYNWVKDSVWWEDISDEMSRRYSAIY